MTLRIHTSNRMETLVELLTHVVRQPLSSVFTPEIIVVQSKGMQRWLSMELASRTGIWANGEFPFPNAIIDRFFSSIIPDRPTVPECSSFHPEVLLWRVLESLPRFLGRKGFEIVAAYLTNDLTGLKALQLAGAIADTFDQYTVYRPEMLARWERGEGDDWQATLWRELARQASGPHRASRLLRFRKLINSGQVPVNLPRRISLIGIPTLPPFHMEVLTAIAAYAEVNLFLLNPCREYWGGIVSEKEMTRMGQQEFDFSGERTYLETGNPLLASFGRIGRNFFETLISNGEADYVDTFVEPGEDSLLHAIQGDILNLRDRRGACRDISPRDHSLRVHSCHSAMREVEVLYDQLLHRLDLDPTLFPRDILVMTPDIESYAPYISAVFGSPERPEEYLPFSIADRSLRRDGAAGEALLAILNLHGSRFTVTQVLDILENPLVSGRFGLGKSELDVIKQWVVATSIRWGIDEKNRAELSLPEFGQNSWRAGLDRLLLGYAMAGNDCHFFEGILPYDHVEGEDATILGQLLDFCETLFSRTAALGKPRQLGQWSAELRELVSLFLKAGTDEGEGDIAALIKVIDGLEEQGTLAAFSSTVSIEVVSFWLEERLNQQHHGFGFLTGGITFCAMLPMRSIPFRVIALLGMNEGVFPRQNKANGFDLIAAAPRPGDRNQRDEDRYLFLEALLSARDHLCISYVGQSIKDNSKLPPSVLVSDLLDYCSKSFSILAPGTPQPVLETVFIQHPLQPFSGKYFCADNHELFSYSRENHRAVLESAAPGTGPGLFLTKPHPAPVETQITIEEMVNFFANPCKILLRQQLGLYLDQQHHILEEEEPFFLDQLCTYQLEQEMVAALLGGQMLDRHISVAVSRGQLPPGEPGLVLYDTLAGAAADFAGQVAAATSGNALPPVNFELEHAGVRLAGRVQGIWPAGLIHYRYARLKAKDRLRLWIELLCLNFAAPPDYPRTGLLLGKDGTLTALPVTEPRHHLEQLLGIYAQGQREPLRFFPETSLEYVRKVIDPKKQPKAMADAAKKWHGSDEYPGEKKDAYFQQCFGQMDPLDDDFITISRQIYEPLLAHVCEKKSKRGSVQ